MQEVRKLQNEIIVPENISENRKNQVWKNYFPAIFAFVGAFLMLGMRIEIGAGLISDSALMMLALASYLLAALFLLTNLYAPSEMAKKIGFFTGTLGVFFNLSSWLVRWVNGFEFQKASLPQKEFIDWLSRSLPFANLYDLSLAFAFGAGIVTLLVANRKQFQILSAFTLPLAALILTLARFIGGEFVDFPPVLDSYWRPIHVGVASLSYGVALVCFAIAVMYLLKDKVKVEALAIWSSIFSLGVIATISKFSVFTEFVYRAGLFTPNTEGGKPFNAYFRLEIPNVGMMLVVSGVLLLGVIVSFIFYIYQNNLTAKKIGHILLKLALIAQIAAIAFLVSGIKSSPNIYPRLQSELSKNSSQYMIVGKELASRRAAGDKSFVQEFAAMTPSQFEMMGKQFFQNNGERMYLNLNANPVELAGLLTALAATFFVILFAFRTEKLRERLPSLQSLDGLMYKTASLAFAGLAMLLITGAIWANDSWGRPWGFDSKETGALVAWLTYAAFLHTRISRGWTGRSSAYFAIVAFLFVIFTYLGVSYLLPGLHSYA
ncbi:hypothetical protein BH10ACI1_BH10ACI1_09180 [soil metagenome]